VTSDAYRDLSPVWLPDNRHLLFVSDRDGPRDIYVVAADDPEEPQRLTFGEYPASISVSADGRRLAYAKHRFRRNIWAVPIPTDGFASIRDGRPITSVGWNQLVMDHDLSSGGDSLVFDFRADPSGSSQIYKTGLDGGAPIQITADSPGDWAPVLSPDGREIVFIRDPEEDSPMSLWVMDADGANQRREVDEYHGYYYDWSPDGLQILYDQDQDGLWALSRDSTRQGFDMPVEFGEPAEWSSVICQAPRWAPDGSSVICNGRRDDREEGGRFWSFLWLSPDGEILSRQDPPDYAELERERDRGFRGEERGPPGLWWMRFPRFSPDGSTIYFFAWTTSLAWAGSGGVCGPCRRRVAIQAWSSTSTIHPSRSGSPRRADRASCSAR
jgi:Tol biopolymer transport system component